MRGKIVNLCISLMNILFGILIIIYTVTVPQDKTLLTVQESNVVKYLLISIYIIMFSVAIIDIVQSYHHRTDTTFNTGYIIGFFSISFLFIKQPTISAFSFITGLIVLRRTLKENLVEINSTTAISVSIVLMSAIVIVGFLTLNYDAIGRRIKDNENKNETAYVEEYFKYVTELDIQDVYINVKKDGKFGYINQKGEVVSEFLYDYASPFVEITAYGKKFYIALVCQNGSSYIILKNGRQVLSYRTESSDENYKAKLEELEDIYTNTLHQTGKMQYEIKEITDNINKVPVYKEVSPDYSFRYDYNNKYDLIVTQSNLGLGDTYELAEKNNLDIKIKLDTTYLDYDSSYLYLFSNGTIPFYEISRKSQGWFSSYGSKKTMTGKAQILDFFGDRILIRNYNNSTVYFVDSEANRLSDEYADIFVQENGKYIVKTLENSFKVINDEYKNVLQKEYSVINPRLISQKLYLTLDTTENIEFNDYNFAKMNWNLMNENGEVVFEGIEQVYDLYYELPEKNKEKETNYYEFEKNLKDLKYYFVGDKFYLNY